LSLDFTGGDMPQLDVAALTTLIDMSAVGADEDPHFAGD
jgi:hypothetical protein